MALDPRIPLGVQAPPQQPSPFEMVTALTQLQGLREQTEARRLAADAARQKAMDDAAIRRVMQESGGDWEIALPQLRQIAPSAAAKLETDVADARNKTLDGLTKRLDASTKTIDLGLKVAETMVDQPSADRGRAMLFALTPDAQQTLAPLIGNVGDPYDAEQVTRVRNMALSRKDQLDLQQKALDFLVSGKPTEAMSTWLSTVRSEQEWNSALAGGKAMGIPDAILSQFGAWSPEAPARAGQLGIAPAKRAELAGQAATRAQTAAHQAVEESIARGHLGVSQAQLQLARQREARLAAGGGAEDVGVSADVRTTSTGRQYVDLSKYKGKDYGAAQRQAHDAGVYGANAGESDALANIETTRQNLDEIEKSIGKLPSSSTTRVISGPLNRLEAYTQWDPDLAAWGAYRSAARQAMRSMAGSKGLRINRAEIEQAMANDIPDITDTQATARQKLARVRKMLTTQENGVMGSPTGGAASPAPPTSSAGGGLTYQDYLNAKKKSGG